MSRLGDGLPQPNGRCRATGCDRRTQPDFWFCWHHYHDLTHEHRRQLVVLSKRGPRLALERHIEACVRRIEAEEAKRTW